MMSKKTKIVLGIIAVILFCGMAFVWIGNSLNRLLSLRTLESPSAPYFLTISEMMKQKDKVVDRQIRISGVVLGDTIKYDTASGALSFFIADIPGDYAEVEKQGGLAVVLENAVNDPDRQRIQVTYSGEKPDLLRNKAQAIMTGKLNKDGVFYADEILLKCPSRYEDKVPDQVVKMP
jgi:cytochrome c-type biogenesis protein CcmE